MLQPIFDFIENLASNFSWRKVVILVVIFLIICLAWFVYESQTATSQLAKYERSVVILERLNSLNLSDPQSKKITENIYQGIDSITKPSRYQISFIDSISLELRQGLFSAVPWLVIMLFFIPTALRGEKTAKDSLLAVTFLGFLIGIVGYFVPTKLGVWMFPIVGNLLFLAILAWLGNKIGK